MTSQPSAPGRPWERYVAIGDSFTEGLSDPDPDSPGGYRGWADRLADHLAARAAARGGELRYANLAVRGRLLSDVVGPQLDMALDLGPDLVSMVGGGNDLLRPRADPDDIAARLDEAAARLRAAGVDVLLATPVDPADAPLIRHLRGRHAVHTANLFTIAQRRGCHVLNLWGLRMLRDWRLWADDRIHLTSEGHRRVALAALSTLGHDPESDDWHLPLPPAPPSRRRETVAANATWAREHLGPWVRRRVQGRSSGDTVTAKRPALTAVPALQRDATGGAARQPDEADLRLP